MDVNKRHWDDEFLDRVLDAGLERMKNVAPRAGLEDRILARLAAEKPKLSWLGWPIRLGLALAALAVILAAAYLAHQRAQFPHTMKDLATTGPASAVSNAVSGHRHRPSAITDRRYRAPRLPVFPSPAPLTRQEKILLGLKNRGRVMLALAESERSSAAPGPAKLEIKPLVIKPLESLASSTDDGGENNGANNLDTQPSDGEK